MIRATSDLLAQILLVAPVVVALAALVLGGQWLRHRGESRTLAMMAGGLVALAIGQAGWTVLIGAAILGIAVPPELQTWTVAMSALMPVALAGAFLVLYFSGWLGRR